MLVRVIVTLASLVAAMPAMAGELRPEEARHFIAGKHFGYTCFDGTTGAGRINADGSVVGTIQLHGTGPVHFVSLPVGTIRVQPDSICASVRGAWYQPCFTVVQVDSRSFRGAISGLPFAYCDFTRRTSRPELTAAPPAHTPSPEDTALLRASIGE
jgi:hypothetical protein